MDHLPKERQPLLANGDAYRSTAPAAPQYYSINDPESESQLHKEHGFSNQLVVRVVGPEEKSEDKKHHSIITIFSIWNTMMGTSLLSMPWALGEAGFVCGLAIMLVMPAICLYTAYRVMKSVDRVEASGEVLEFSDVCKHYFGQLAHGRTGMLLGRFGELCSVFFSIITLLGGTIVYWVLMSNFLFNFVTFIYDKAEHQVAAAYNNTPYNDQYLVCPHPPSTLQLMHVGLHSGSNYSNSTDAAFDKYWDMQKTVPFFLLIVLVPLINFKSATFFTKFNALGTVSVLYLLGFVTYKASTWGIHIEWDIIPKYRSLFPALTGTLALAYFIHNCILSIVRHQARPENNGRDLTIAYVCVAVTYTYVGAMFYASFPLFSKLCIEDNLLNNFLTADPAAFVARLCLFFQMVTVFPLLLYILRIQFMHTLFGTVWPSVKHVLLLNALVVAVCVLFARFLPKIGTIIRYTGALSGFAYAFFLPCAVHVLSLRQQGKLTKTSAVVHLALASLGLANFVAQFCI